MPSAVTSPIPTTASLLTAAASPAAPRRSFAGGVNDPVIQRHCVGGAGVNAVNRSTVEAASAASSSYVTDLQSLAERADLTVHIGGGTRGLGSGSDPELGHELAFEEQDRIKRMLKGSDMVFVAAAPARRTAPVPRPSSPGSPATVGAPTVGIVTCPFVRGDASREAGRQGHRAARFGEVDTLIVVPNDRLLGPRAQHLDGRGVPRRRRRAPPGRQVLDLITLPALINLDFADVRTTMRDAGPALLGIGMGIRGHPRHLRGRAGDRLAVARDLDRGGRSILLSITGGGDLSLVEISEAARVISRRRLNRGLHIIFGANVDDTLDEQIWVMPVATRFDARGRRADGSSTGVHRSTARPSSRRASDERSGARTVPGHEAELRDLGIDVPEFIPN